MDLAPSIALIDPAAGRIDANRLNSSSRLNGGPAFIDVLFIAPSGASLDYDSIFDTGTEFTLLVNGVAKAVSGVPVPIVTPPNVSSENASVGSNESP